MASEEVTRLICDNCRETTESSNDRYSGTPLAPGWLTLTENRVSITELRRGPYHFCGLQCLQQWVDREHRERIKGTVVGNSSMVAREYLNIHKGSTHDG